MNRSEALEILGLTDSSSDEDAKKRYRELTKKYHPDINKEAGAEDKFKKINAAYATLQAPEPEPEVEFGFNPFGQHGSGLHDLFQNLNIQFHHQTHTPLEINLDVSFEESIKGCRKDLTIDRMDPCDSCKGLGVNFIPRTVVCGTCSGKGQVVVEYGNMKIVRPCQTCGGQNKIRVECKACSGKGGKTSSHTCQVSIPPGIESGNILRMQGMGHFLVGSVPTQYADAFLVLNVKPHVGMQRRGNDVISEVTVPLLDCLQGGTVKRATLYGDVDFEIPAGSKNKDEVLIPGHGVQGTNGNHRFVILTQYPDNPQKLISHLKLMAIKV